MPVTRSNKKNKKIQPNVETLLVNEDAVERIGSSNVNDRELVPSQAVPMNRRRQGVSICDDRSCSREPVMVEGRDRGLSYNKVGSFGRDTEQPSQSKDCPSQDARSVRTATSSRRSGRSARGTLTTELRMLELEKQKLDIAMKEVAVKQRLLEMEEAASNQEDDISESRFGSHIAVSTMGVAKERSCANEVRTWLDGQREYDSIPAPGPLVETTLQSLSKVFADVIEAVQGRRDDRMDKLMARQTFKHDLPSFSGRVEEWTNFYNEFNRTTAACAFSNDENLSRLQKSLHGRARSTVQALMFSGENVGEIMQILKSTYGRPDHIVLELVRRVRSWPCLMENKFRAYMEFSNEIRNLVGTMEGLNYTGHMTNPELLSELVEKLPSFLKIQWGMNVVGLGEQATLKDFSTWFQRIAEATNQICVPVMKTDKSLVGAGRNSSENRPKKNHSMLHIDENNILLKNQKKQDECVICTQNHGVKECREFQEKTVDNRWKVVKELKLCFCCLECSHLIMNCRKKKKCSTNGCQKLHHPLLHNLETVRDKKLVTFVEYPGTTMLRIARVTVIGPKRSINIFALFDEGSTVTLLDQAVADVIGCDGPTKSICFHWMKDVTKQEDESKTISFQIQGAGEQMEKYDIKSAYTVRDFDIQPQSFNAETMKKKYPFLSKIGRLESFENVTPLLLIGQDNINLTIPRRIVEASENGPILSWSKLGWTFHGRTTLHKHRVNFSCFHVCDITNDADENLHELVKSSYQLDSLGIMAPETKQKSREDRNAEQLMENTIKRVGNRFEIGLLWKKKDEKLPDSYNNALMRLRCVERKMDKDQQYSQLYCSGIEKYIEKGYARKVDIDANPPEKLWYLPHFGVTNPNKPGKLRLVFDAASKCSGRSLNDALLQGPDLLTPLIGVLLRFRLRRVAFCGDIKEMFHQILIRDEDCAAQRFLWRGTDRFRDPDIYEMKAMTFGATSSPCLAQFVKNYNAKEFESQYPDAVRAIVNQHYVDDYLDSAESDEAAIKLIRDVIYVHSQGGFQICGWITNSEKVRESIPDDLRGASSSHLNIDNEPLERVLGLWWNPTKDVFTYKLNQHKIDAKLLTAQMTPTKRQVLKVVMSVFDPLGFLSPFLIKGRILLQHIWKCGVGWDDQIPHSLHEKWKEWLRQLSFLPELCIPRCYSGTLFQDADVQLHIFCDASEEAYCAVAYLRIKRGHNVQVAFIMSKGKVAPLKQTTIPRLELLAALMGSRMANTIKGELEVNIRKTCYWTDSKTVLCWLRTNNRRLKMFVAQRVGEIEEATNIPDWRWVPSHLNVSDDCTRFDSPELHTNKRWFGGPEFLQRECDDWPKEHPDGEERGEEEYLQKVLVVNHTEQTDHLPDIERFSSSMRLLRSTAWMMRFINNCRSTVKKTDELCPEEIKLAEKLWWKKVQEETFGAEKRQLEKGKFVDKRSSIYDLSPQLDEDGVLRLGGRIGLQNLVSHGVKCPVILPQKHRFTCLMIQHYHELHAHQGQEQVFNEIRQHFWVVNLRMAIKKVFYDCQKCKVKKAKPSQQEMGLIPEARLDGFSPPFTQTGVDYFGPFLVKVGRRHEKRYGVIFTCLTTRAVHLEIAASLTTDSAILAIRRFIARRGYPKTIYSDNGKNFVGAEKELRQAVAAFNQKELVAEMCTRGIEWKFNPPLAPHMGGAWERLIRSIKTALRWCLFETVPKEEVLTTLIVEVENMVNSRPLTHVPVDPIDQTCLTPNHFLIGSSSAMQTLGVPEPGDENLRRQWKATQALTLIFWKRWMKEYVPTLVKRQKWFQKHQNLRVGELVLIADSQSPRNSWPMGVIVAVYPGRDDRVRVVDVKTQFGVLKRPIHKLCKLDVQT